MRTSSGRLEDAMELEVEELVRQFEARVFVDGLTDQEGQFVSVLARRGNSGKRHWNGEN